MDMIQYIGSIGGVAGVLAALMFLSYRHLVGQMRDDRRFMEDRLSGIIKDYNDSAKAHTQATTELITWLKARNGHN